MFREETIKDLIELVGYETTQYLIAIRTINATLNIKLSDIENDGIFSKRDKRVIKKASKIIPLSDEKIINLLKLVCELSLMDMCKGMNGLGGYQEKPVSYYVHEYLGVK